MKTSILDPISSELFNRQIRKVTLIVLAAFAVLALRLWSLQILSGTHYRTKSEKNRIRLQDIPPFRGLIYDRNGNVLVNNKPSYSLYVIPEEIQNEEQLFELLQRLISLDPDELRHEIRKKGRRMPFKPLLLKKGLSRDELAVIETHRFNLPGIFVKVVPQRNYVMGKFASHVLGYLGEITENQLRSGRHPYSKVGDLIGKAGVELKWQKFLNGMRGGEQIEVDAAGRKIRVISRIPPRPGADLYLTIDKKVQEIAEKALEGKSGAVVALDPNNGQVLAMASSPSFDPNIFIRGIDKECWREMISGGKFPLQNRAIAGLYSPGSVFKIPVALAALQEHIITPQDTFFCNGQMRLGNRTFRCWKRWGHGNVDLAKALIESCDVYFYNVGKELGVDKIAKYAKDMGLGEFTGFDLGFEKRGLVPTRKWKQRRFGNSWQMGETLSLAIGQSFLLVTPIQMACMISAVFNGGILYQPQVTKSIMRQGGKELYEFVPKIKRYINANYEDIEIVKKALIGVVNDPHGTGKRAKIEGITVAGKTGTAQVVGMDSKKGDVEDDEVAPEFRDHAWFVAVAPAEDPKIAVSVLIEHGGHGGSAAAPVAKDVMEVYLKELGII